MFNLCKIINGQIFESNDATERREKFMTEKIPTEELNFNSFDQVIEFIGKISMDN